MTSSTNSTAAIAIAILTALYGRFPITLPVRAVDQHLPGLAGVQVAGDPHRQQHELVGDVEVAGVHRVEPLLVAADVAAAVLLMTGSICGLASADPASGSVSYRSAWYPAR